MTYTKHIESWPTGGIYAEIHREDETRCEMKLFNNPFRSKKGNFKKAHKWADAMIETLEEYECRVDE